MLFTDNNSARHMRSFSAGSVSLGRVASPTARAVLGQPAAIDAASPDAGVAGTGAVKEQEAVIQRLQKHNFNLMLRIYYLEERLSQLTGADGGEEDMSAVHEQVIELKVLVEQRSQELEERNVLLVKVGVWGRERACAQRASDLGPCVHDGCGVVFVFLYAMCVLATRHAMPSKACKQTWSLRGSKQRKLGVQLPRSSKSRSKSEPWGTCGTVSCRWSLVCAKPMMRPTNSARRCVYRLAVVGHGRGPCVRDGVFSLLCVLIFLAFDWRRLSPLAFVLNVPFMVSPIALQLTGLQAENSAKDKRLAQCVCWCTWNVVSAWATSGISRPRDVFFVVCWWGH